MNRHRALAPTDFKSVASTISPRPLRRTGEDLADLGAVLNPVSDGFILKGVAACGVFGLAGEARPTGREREIGGFQIGPGRQFRVAQRVARKFAIEAGPLERREACRHDFGH